MAIRFSMIQQALKFIQRLFVIMMSALNLNIVDFEVGMRQLQEAFYFMTWA